MLRSAWLAQELLSTFNGTLAAVELLPNHEGTGCFEVSLATRKNAAATVLWDRSEESRFPEAKECVQRLRSHPTPRAPRARVPSQRDDARCRCARLKQRVRDVIDPEKDLGHSDEKEEEEPTDGEEDDAQGDDDDEDEEEEKPRTKRTAVERLLSILRRDRKS